MSTRLTYRAAVKLRGYDSVADATIDAAVEEARRRVLTDHEWTFLETSLTPTMVAGNDTISLTALTTLGDVQAVRLSDAGGPVPCAFKPIEQMRDLQDGGTNGWSADPLYWSTRGTDLIFWPTPHRVLTVEVECTLKYVALSADATVCVIPDKHADLVTWAACVPLAFRQRQLTESSAADQFYTKVLLPLHKGRDKAKQSQSSQQIKTGYWGPR